MLAYAPRVKWIETAPDDPKSSIGLDSVLPLKMCKSVDNNGAVEGEVKDGEELHRGEDEGSKSLGPPNTAAAALTEIRKSQAPYAVLNEGPDTCERAANDSTVAGTISKSHTLDLATNELTDTSIELLLDAVKTLQLEPDDEVAETSDTLSSPALKSSSPKAEKSPEKAKSERSVGRLAKVI